LNQDYLPDRGMKNPIFIHKPITNWVPLPGTVR
jgi:hypothetical protein